MLISLESFVQSCLLLNLGQESTDDLGIGKQAKVIQLYHLFIEIPFPMFITLSPIRFLGWSIKNDIAWISCGDWLWRCRGCRRNSFDSVRNQTSVGEEEKVLRSHTGSPMIHLTTIDKQLTKIPGEAKKARAYGKKHKFKILFLRCDFAEWIIN